MPNPDKPSSNQPIIVAKGELSKRFRPLTPAEEADLGLKKAKKELEPRKPQERISLLEAEAIMQQDFLGPQAVEKAFGLKLDQKDIPPIPFSQRDLERTKELGQFLVLRVDKASDGEVLTMQKMHSLLQEEFTKKNLGKILYKVDWYENEALFTQDTPELRWALVSKEILPDSTSKNYVQQTELIVEYLQNQVFKDQEALPKEYQEAIQEFADQKAELTQLLTSDWQKAAEKLENLKITQLTRQTPSQALYDCLIYLKNNNQRLLENRATWTSRRSSDGRLVDLGFDAAGAGVVRWRPGSAFVSLGVSLSRSL